MQVEAIKIFKYDPTDNGKFSRYAGYCLSTSEQVDFPIISPSETIAQLRFPLDGVIYHSPLLRARQTVDLLSKTNTCKSIQRNELKEVPFLMEELVTDSEFATLGSSLVRKRFIDAFIHDQLLESRLSIQMRISRLFEILANSEYRQATIVSHSFILKMIEASIGAIDIFSNPENIRLVIPQNQKTYNFGEGFTFQID